MKRFSTTLLVFLLALIVYAISSQVWAHPISLAPHYVYLADSLLHGHVDLIQLPPVTYDLLQFKDHWYIAGSPMPSILMLPFVAIFGVNFSDVLFSVVLGAINVALVYSLLGTFINHGDAETQREEKEITPRLSVSAASSLSIIESARRWITLLFALGTPHWYLASLGTYWFTAQTVAVFFSLLAVREALTKRRWFLCGLWLACASFSRPTAFGLIPFFAILIALLDAHPVDSIKISWRVRSFAVKSLPFAAAIIIGLAAHGIYNYTRFGSIGDFGYAYGQWAQNIASAYARYGGFNPRFLPCNMAVSLTGPPEVNGWVPGFITHACEYLLIGINLSDISAPIVPNPLGMSIFFATPALLAIFAAHRRDPLIVAAWIGLLATLIPLWMFHNTGSLQFGYRYIFDAAPMWIILLASGMGAMNWWKRGLILISIAINLWGFLWMFEKLVGVNWFG